MGEGCHCPRIAFVVLIVALVLIEPACAVRTWDHLEDYLARIAYNGAPNGIERDDAAGTIEHGELIERVDAVEGLLARQQTRACHIPPFFILAGEPYHAAAIAVLLRHVDGRHQHVVSKQILILVNVSVAILGIVIIEGTVYADARVVGLAGSCIEVGEKAVAQTHSLAQLLEIAVLPNAALQLAVVRGMRAKDRCVCTELQPAQEQFRIVVAALMTAQVMPPIVVEHIAGIAGEEYLVGQC